MSYEIETGFREKSDKPGHPCRALWVSVLLQAFKDLRDGGKDGADASLFFFSPIYAADRTRVCALANFDEERIVNGATQARRRYQREARENAQASRGNEEGRSAPGPETGKPKRRRAPSRFNGGHRT